uniref:Endoplasmic reticulum transmembrane protein n=2 Tax=Aegilops tauschii TaxID=37682 RepID=A0A453MI45_AEGTS
MGRSELKCQKVGLKRSLPKRFYFEQLAWDIIGCSSTGMQNTFIFIDVDTELEYRIFSQPSNGSSLVAGYTLFLAFVIDRLHHYLQKLITLRKSANTSREEVEKLQMENRSLREKEEKSTSEMKKLQQDMAKLSEDMKKLKSESEDHQRKASDAEAHVNALQKQSEELLLEYDRLLEDNQILQSQLHYKG